MSELSSCGTGSISVSAELAMNDNPISKLHYIDWDLDHTLVPEKGRLSWNVQDQTLDLGLNDNVNLQIGQESVVLCKAAEPILKGQAVYISGSEGNSENFLVSVASNDTELTSHNTLGIAAEDFGDAGQETHGYITTFGRITGIDTSNLDAGELIYLGLNGALTKDRPLSPDHEIILGYCIRTQQNNGVIYVSVDLGFHLEELHDASLTNIQNNDVLLYNSTSALWENVTSNNWESTYTTMGTNSANWVKYNIEDIATPAAWVLDVDTLTDTALPDGSPIKVPTQQSVKAYVDGIVTGVNNLKGGYDASTDTPPITAGIGVLQGDTYYVTASGTFYTQQVDKGDLIIATIDNADADGEWIVVNRNIDEELFDKWDSTSTTVGANSAIWGETAGTELGPDNNSNPAVTQLALNIKERGTSAAQHEGIVQGNLRGASAVDLQIYRTAADQIAAGPRSAITGGDSNKISTNCSSSTITGGLQNVINVSNYSTIVGGRNNIINKGQSVATGGYCEINHINSFMFNNSSTWPTVSSNTFNVKALNGMRLEFDTTPIPGQVLTCLESNGISKWASLSADEWNSTYTTVGAQSANWSEGASTGVVFDTSQGTAVNHASLKVKDTNTGYSPTDGFPIGDTRGAHAVDLQIFRENSDQVAAGVSSTIVGGQYNKIQGGDGAGSYGAILGGNRNEIYGQYNTVIGGSTNKIGDGITLFPGNGTTIGQYNFIKHGNCFSYNDQSGVQFETKQVSTFNIHATNGFRLVTGGLNTPDPINIGDVLTCYDTDGHSKWASLSADEWNSTYTTVSSESANWDSTYTTVSTNSANWDSNYTTTSTNSASWSNSQQTINSSAGTLTLDVSQGQSAVTTLTENITTFTITNASAGDSGVLIISSDGGGWTFPDQDSLGASHIVHTGSPSGISTLTSTTSSAVSIGWYCDGSKQFLYISDPT